MSMCRAVASVSLLLLSFAAFAQTPLQKLDAARDDLTKAVERIKPDPPSNADLDAAAAAVEALKTAIDAGAELEQSDLDYAKSALAARKELRTQREYVDQRRANVKIFDARRAIDAAMKPLDDSVAALQAKDKEPSPKDFENARAAAAAVKKLADESRPFGKQDAKFGAYLAQTDAAIARQLKAVDDRETLLAVDRQKVKLDAALKALDAATSPLAKGATDDQFQAGDKAAIELVKRLEEGKPLEAKSKAYAGDAGKARAQLAAAKKKMDALWTETGLTRLKSEIDPAYKDLVAAAKPIHGKPTPDQLAEARTAAIVVRGLVEKFQPEAARSQAFGQYVEQVRRTLVDVESEIERRSLLAAEKDVILAQRAIEKKGATDEQFAELDTAMSVLEKTLAAVHAKEPAMAPTVAEASWALKEAKAMTIKRRVEVDVDRQRAKVEDARKIAADAMAQLQQSTFAQEQLTQADNAVKLIGKVLAEGSGLVAKAKDYAAYDRDVKARITELEAKIAAKKLQLAASDARTALNTAVATAKAKIQTAQTPEGKDSDVEAAVAAEGAMEKLLETQAPLEKQDRGYAAVAQKLRDDDLFRLQDNLELAKLSRELRKKTGEVLVAGSAVVDKAAGVKDLRARKAEYVKAVNQLRSCQSDGNELLRSYPILVKTPVLVDGKTQTPREVIEQCGKRVEAAELLLKEIAPLIKFEDGPKKSYEQGRALLDKGKKSEALAQFNECIATGVILRNDQPDFADRKFDVAGGQQTLAEMIKYCAEQRKALQPK